MKIGVFGWQKKQNRLRSLLVGLANKDFEINLVLCFKKLHSACTVIMENEQQI